MLSAGCYLLNAACLLPYAVCEVLDADGFSLAAICFSPCFFETSACFVALMAAMSKNTLLPHQYGPEVI